MYGSRKILKLLNHYVLGEQVKPSVVNQLNDDRIIYNIKTIDNEIINILSAINVFNEFTIFNDLIIEKEISISYMGFPFLDSDKLLINIKKLNDVKDSEFIEILKTNKNNSVIDIYDNILFIQQRGVVVYDDNRQNLNGLINAIPIQLKEVKLYKPILKPFKTI